MQVEESEQQQQEQQRKEFHYHKELHRSHKGGNQLGGHQFKRKVPPQSRLGGESVPSD